MVSRGVQMLKVLFLRARFNPQAPINQAGRLMGKHCVSRKLRWQAKRRKVGKAVYAP